MARKDENFDFDTESKAKLSLDLGFLKNLTQKQKETILMIAITVVAVVVIVVIGVLVFTGGGNGGNSGGITGDNGNSDNGGTSGENGGTVPSTEIQDIYLATKPTKRKYLVGEQPNYNGMVVAVTSADGDTTQYAYEENAEMFTITGFDSSVPVEDQIVTVEYMGHTTVFKVQILPIPGEETHLVSIELISMPKTEFKVGDAPSFKNGMILCTYSDGSTKEVKLTFSLTSGFEYVDDPGEYTIVVEYVEEGYSATTEYTITVTE